MSLQERDASSGLPLAHFYFVHEEKESFLIKCLCVNSSKTKIVPVQGSPSPLTVLRASCITYKLSQKQNVVS